MMGGGFIQLFKEIISQPKLDIFRGVEGYGLVDTKFMDTLVKIKKLTFSIVSSKKGG